MSKLLASKPENVLGASADLKTRFVRLRNDREGGSFQPGQWETLTLNASPVGNLQPGNQTIVEHLMPQGTPKKAESMLLRWGVVNSHPTDTLRTVNPLNFISSMRVFVNGLEIHRYQAAHELRLLQSEHLLGKHELSEAYADLARIRQSYDRGTLTPENYPAATTTDVVLDLYQLFPWLRGLIVSSPNNRVRSLKFEIVFQPSAGSVLDANWFINATGAGAIYTGANVRFDNVRLEYQLAEVVSQALLAQPAPMWPVTKFHSATYDLDLSLATNTKTVRLNQDLPRSSLIYRTFFLVQDVGAVTAYNDADGGGKLYSGPDALRMTFKKTGAITAMDLRGGGDAHRWLIQTLRMASGKSPDPELYDGTGDITESYIHLPSIDWRTVGVSNDSNGHELGTLLIGGLNTANGATDYTIDVSPAADGLFSAGARLHVVNAYFDLYTVEDSGAVRRMQVTA